MAEGAVLYQAVPTATCLCWTSPVRSGDWPPHPSTTYPCFRCPWLGDSNGLEWSILVLKCVQQFCCSAAEHRLPITFKTSLSPFKLDTPNENMPSTLSKFKVFKFWLEPLCARSCSCIIFIQMLKCPGTWFWLQPTNLACCLTLTVSFTLSHIRLPRQKTEQCRISS